MHFVKQLITSFNSHNMLEEAEEWNSGYTYQVSAADPLPDGDGGAVANYGNSTYRTLINDNTNNLPTDELSTKWLKYEVSNSFAMLDLSATSKSYFIPSFTTTGASQVVDLVIDDVVYVEVLGSATGTEGNYYKALTTRSTIELNTEDFTNGTNWELSANKLVVEFDRGDIDTLVVGNYSATYITVEMIDIDGETVLDTQVREHGVSEDVTDYWSYVYSQYSITTGLDLAFKLLAVGVTIRVTFESSISGEEVSCGFLIGGIAEDMGDTRIGVGFSFNSYSVRNTDDFGVLTITKRGIQQLVDFETYADSKSIAGTLSKIKQIYDEIVVFIVDPLEDSLYDSIITMGVVESVTTVLQNPVQSVVAWSIQETL